MPARDLTIPDHPLGPPPLVFTVDDDADDASEHRTRHHDAAPRDARAVVCAGAAKHGRRAAARP